MLQEGRAAATHHASQLYPVSLNDDDHDDDDIWSAVLPRGPPAATPTAQPGMYGSEQYNEAQLHSLFVFKYLLVFVAALESFAHGANDTGNATGKHHGVVRSSQPTHVHEAALCIEMHMPPVLTALLM